MPLNERQEFLLHELYSIAQQSETLTLGEGGLSTAPPLSDVVQSPRDHLARAILSINREEFKVERVGEILSEYEGISLDPSNIDRDGYSFRFKNSIFNLQQRLYPYTGIIVKTGSSSNRTPLG